MSRPWVLSATVISALFVVGCHKEAFVNPWALNSPTYTRVWHPDLESLKQVRCVGIEEPYDLPGKDDLLSLGDLFDIGLRNNPSTKRAWEFAREKAAAYGVSLAPYLPNISFQGDVFDAERQGSMSHGTFSTTKEYSYGPEINFNYMIWDFARTPNADMFFQALESANWEYNETLQGVLRSVSDAYYDYLYQRAYLEYAQADMINAEQTYQAASEKMLSGIYDTTDMLQAKTAYLQRKIRVTSQIAVTENSFVKLLNVLGIPSHASFRLGGFPELPPGDPLPENVEVLVEMAKKHRPMIQSAKALVLEKEYSVKKANAERLPKISLTSQGGANWFQKNNFDKGNFNIAVDLTFPIFAGYYYINQIKRAEADLKQAQANLRNAELTTVKEIKYAYNNYQMAKQQLVDTKQYLEAAEVEFDAILLRYKQGLASILNLLTANTFLADARSQRAEAQQYYYTSLINMAYAIGSLTTSYSQRMEQK